VALGKRKGSGNEELPVPLNTLIDVVFLLLVYFVITWSAPIPEAHLAVNLPSPGESTQEDPPPVLQIEVRPEKILVQGKAYSIDEIRPRLKNLAEMQSEQPVIVKVSGEIKTHRLVQVLDMCKGLGFETVNVMSLKG